MLVHKKTFKEVRFKLSTLIVDEIENVTQLAERHGYELNVNQGIEKYLEKELLRIKQQLNKSGNNKTDLEIEHHETKGI